MSIPLNQIYNYLDKINNEIYRDSILIYHFWPHGSKKIQDLTGLHSRYDTLDYFDKLQHANMIMYDQEPLKYDQYRGTDIIDYICNSSSNTSTGHRPFNWPFNWPITENTTTQELKIIEVYKDLNLRFATGNPFSVFDLTLLVHSEKNSAELEIYEKNGFVGVYWWCHAVIARDWFRYYQYVKQEKKVNKTFLIYNRAWSGTREYRLKFIELLIRAGIEKQCQTNVNSIEPELGIHYTLHTFDNPQWKPDITLEDYFSPSKFGSNASGDIVLDDYESNDIEVVLETLFDDSRQQLTEKALRPIAAAQPFILVSTAGSLEYLRSYGFKTFGDLWDEQYDLVADPKERLVKIIEVMQQIANWDSATRINKMTQAQAIADYNKKLFFSEEWHQGVIDEYKNNFSTAMKTMIENITAKYTKKLQQLNPDSMLTAEKKETRRKIFEIADQVKKKFTT
jgi:hypothetical protein